MEEGGDGVSGPGCKSLRKNLFMGFGLGRLCIKMKISIKNFQHRGAAEVLTNLLIRHDDKKERVMHTCSLL